MPVFQLGRQLPGRRFPVPWNTDEKIFYGTQFLAIVGVKVVMRTGKPNVLFTLFTGEKRLANKRDAKNRIEIFKPLPFVQLIRVGATTVIGKAFEKEFVVVRLHFNDEPFSSLIFN